MIKFFRKIRQRLLIENKFSKYLIYAIGEIVLVVIGILIALQINNWNENKKTKIKELKILRELSSDLTQNLDDININLLYLSDSQKSNEIILYFIENNIPYNDSLNYHFSNLYPFTTFNVNQTTYESLKQMGLYLISNDSLRISISDLYANQYTKYIKFEDMYMIENYNNFIKPLYISEFISLKFRTSALPRSYNQFMNNPRYKVLLNWNVEMYKSFIIQQSGLKEKVKELIIQIDKEIDD